MVSRLHLGSPVMQIAKLWPIVLLLASVSGASTEPSSPSTSKHGEALSEREKRTFKEPQIAAHFADVAGTRHDAGCEQTNPPQALTTPMPLTPLVEDDRPVVVSFIIGTDGSVRAPLILEGANLDSRSVLAAVSHWRYRPATCNGVPTESEARVQFSRR